MTGSVVNKSTAQKALAHQIRDSHLRTTHFHYFFLPFYPVRLIDKTSDSVSPKAVRVQKSGETNLRLSRLSHPFCRNTFALK